MTRTLFKMTSNLDLDRVYNKDNIYVKFADGTEYLLY